LGEVTVTIVERSGEEEGQFAFEFNLKIVAAQIHHLEEDVAQLTQRRRGRQRKVACR